MQTALFKYFQIRRKIHFPNSREKARGKIWETLLHSPVSMGLPRQVFSAVFRTLTGRLFLQATLSANWCERHSRAPSVSLRRAMNFIHLMVCASLVNTGFNFSSDNFTAKAGLFWAVRREMAYMAHFSV
ncbi:uncharacterized protein TNCV_3915591 [Trichonephila clavipes]|nr:uncharacterized protein TNCV_3915591 [Trichonephila clavipes]